MIFYENQPSQYFSTKLLLEPDGSSNFRLNSFFLFFKFQVENITSLSFDETLRLGARSLLVELPVTLVFDDTE